MKTWHELKKELLDNPEAKRQYDALGPEYELARELLQARLGKNLTQTELAERAGVSQVIIARLESGTSNPTLETISKVAKVLGKRVKLVGAQ